MFTKEHYIKIAEVLKKSYPFKLPVYLIMRDLVVMFKDDNSKFNQEEFFNMIEGKEVVK